MATYTVHVPDGTTRTTSSQAMANQMAANSGGSVTSSSVGSGGSSSGNNNSSGGGSYSSGGGGSSSGTNWENRVINGSTYTVPTGTDSNWRPGDPHSNPAGAIDAPGFNNQQNIESVVGNNYTTNDDGTYSSNWDTGKQQEYDNAFQGYAQANYPQYYEQEMARQAEERARQEEERLRQAELERQKAIEREALAKKLKEQEAYKLETEQKTYGQASNTTGGISNVINQGAGQYTSPGADYKAPTQYSATIDSGGSAGAISRYRGEDIWKNK